MRRMAALTITLLVMAMPLGGRASEPVCDWPMYGHDLGHSFASGCSNIARVDASTLHPKWVFRTPSTVTAQPAVRWGMVFVGSGDGTFYAMATDPPPGPVKPVWTFSVTDTNKNDYGAVVSSAATDEVGGKRIIVFAGGSTLYVLDAMSGAKLADACFDPRPNPPAGRCKGSDQTIEIESSPAIVHRHHKTFITVGMDFNEDPNTGRAGMVGLQLKTNPVSLVPLWKFDPERQVTYTSDAEKNGDVGFEYTPNIFTAGGTGQGCGNVWSSPTVDTDLGLVYFGTGNCGKTMPAGEFGGEANYAVDLVTGALAWRYAPRGNNDLDLDIGASPNLLPNGLVGEGGKDGTYYAFHRANATAAPQPVWKTKLGAASSIGGMIASTAVGMVKGGPAIFAATAIPLDPNSGIDQTALSKPQELFGLHAIDARDGHPLWDAPALPAYGAPVYTNGVVLVPDTFGFSVQAYDADNGLPLWEFPLNGAPSSAPAVVGDSIYMGTGTSANGLPLSSLSGIWAFQAVSAP
jgi:outer membrane protein assembly factor BamB